MLTFKLASDDRLHFASKAIYLSDQMYASGILILTDKRLYFGAVGQQLHFDLLLQDISSWSAEVPAEQWPPAIEKERLYVVERSEHIFALNDSASWDRKLRWRIDIVRPPQVAP